MWPVPFHKFAMRGSNIWYFRYRYWSSACWKMAGTAMDIFFTSLYLVVCRILTDGHDREAWLMSATTWTKWTMFSQEVTEWCCRWDGRTNRDGGWRRWKRQERSMEACDPDRGEKQKVFLNIKGKTVLPFKNWGTFCSLTVFFVPVTAPETVTKYSLAFVFVVDDTVNYEDGICVLETLGNSVND